MNKIIEAKLKQTPKSEFLFYYPYLSLTEQIDIVPKKTNGRKRVSKPKPVEQKKEYETERQKSKKTQAFVRYVSMKKTYNISPILKQKETKIQSIKKIRPAKRVERNIKSASLNKNSSQIEEVKAIFSQQLFKTQTLLSSNRQEFQIPGITFKNGNNANSLQIIRKRQHGSSTHYETQKMINIESIIQRNCKNFPHLMIEFYKRANISSSLIFVFNSEDVWVKNLLIKRRWIQNLNKDSRAYHLSWTYKPPKIQPFSQQLVNHFTQSDAITSKYRLKEQLKCYNCMELQPITFDLSKQRQKFNSYFAKSEFCSILTKFLNLFSFDYQVQTSSYPQIEIQAQQLKKRIINEQYSSFNSMLLRMIDNSSHILSGNHHQIVNSEFNVAFKHQLNNLTKLTNLQQCIIGFLKKMYDLLKTHYNLSQIPRNVWILKSRTGSKGAGIILSNNLNEIYKNESKLVQKYIEDPLLLDGINRHKFDIRLWVLVTGFKSIEIYYYKGFYGRISSQKYNCEPQQIRNGFIHLTNYSVNKCKYEEADNMQESIIFSEDVFELIRYEYGIDYQAQFYSQIQQMLSKLRPIIENEVCRDKESNRFQLFGFDLLIDSKFRLHLLEINLSAKCDERHAKLSAMLQDMGNGLLNIIQNKQQLNSWKLLAKDT